MRPRRPATSCTSSRATDCSSEGGSWKPSPVAPSKPSTRPQLLRHPPACPSVASTAAVGAVGTSAPARATARLRPGGGGPRAAGRGGSGRVVGSSATACPIYQPQEQYKYTQQLFPFEP